MTVFKSHNSETKISENNEKRTGASFHEDKHCTKKSLKSLERFLSCLATCGRTAVYHIMSVKRRRIIIVTMTLLKKIMSVTKKQLIQLSYMFCTKKRKK